MIYTSTAEENIFLRDFSATCVFYDFLIKYNLEDIFFEAILTYMYYKNIQGKKETTFYFIQNL